MAIYNWNSIAEEEEGKEEEAKSLSLFERNRLTIKNFINWRKKKQEISKLLHKEEIRGQLLLSL